MFPLEIKSPVSKDAIRLSHNSLEAVLEPLDGFRPVDAVGRTNLGLGPATTGNALSRSGPILISGELSGQTRGVINIHAAVEVHSVDTNCWIVLDTKIDVLADTESKVTSL